MGYWRWTWYSPLWHVELINEELVVWDALLLKRQHCPVGEWACKHTPSDCSELKTGRAAARVELAAGSVRVQAASMNTRGMRCSVQALSQPVNIKERGRALQSPSSPFSGDPLTYLHRTLKC